MTRIGTCETVAPYAKNIAYLKLCTIFFNNTQTQNIQIQQFEGPTFSCYSRVNNKTVTETTQYTLICLRKTF